MKKIVIALVSVLVALIVFIVGTEIYGNRNKVEVNTVTAEEVYTQFENDEDFLLVVGTTTCGYCIKYKDETLPEYLEENNKYPLSLMNIDENKNTVVNDIYQDFISKKLRGTPTTYLVIDGEVKNEIDGFIPYEDLETFIENNE